MMIHKNKPDDGEGKEGEIELPQGKVSMKEQRLIKAERREKWKPKKRTKRKGKGNNKN